MRVLGWGLMRVGRVFGAGGSEQFFWWFSADPPRPLARRLCRSGRCRRSGGGAVVGCDDRVGTGCAQGRFSNLFQQIRKARGHPLADQGGPERHVISPVPG
jgi:hypothetical protein